MSVAVVAAHAKRKLCAVDQLRVGVLFRFGEERNA